MLKVSVNDVYRKQTMKMDWLKGGEHVAVMVVVPSLVKIHRVPVSLISTMYLIYLLVLQV